MTDEQKQSFIDIIRSCEDVILATNRPDKYPDARNVINIFNREITDLDLYFFTSTRWKTLWQVSENHNICLYYFNPATRMSLRLFGRIEIIEDMREKQNRFLPGIKKFGVTGYDDPTYVFLRFTPEKYKYYIGFTQYEGYI
ncbi:MAG: pyridoxamine 5'-phosphate oxidase family protein [Alphaproteobacteria bacterium]|nr:pyridoxamine 5'-phosphate oxidase family protein [Alphaproteobacteria bacterium]